SHAFDEVTGYELIERSPSVHDVTEDGVLTVKMRLRRERDEPLASPRVSPVQREAEGSPKVRERTEFIAHGVTGPAVPVTARLAILDDKAGHDAVHGQPVEVTGTRLVDERLRDH